MTIEERVAKIDQWPLSPWWKTGEEYFHVGFGDEFGDHSICGDFQDCGHLFDEGEEPDKMCPDCIAAIWTLAEEASKHAPGLAEYLRAQQARDATSVAKTGKEAQ